MTKDQIKARYTLAFLGYLPVFVALFAYYVNPMIDIPEPHYITCDVYHHNAPPHLRCSKFEENKNES